MDEQRLSSLRPGDRATIGRVEGRGPVRRRLLELGLTPGTPVTLVRLAPLRDPIEIRVRGYQLCVRRAEADAVQVCVEPEGAQHGDTETRRSNSRKPGRSRVPSALSPSMAVLSASVSPCLRVASSAFTPFRSLRRR
jgi:ferrous iron transport protein A